MQSNPADSNAAQRRIWNRLDGVDLLRSLAILLVLLNHVNMRLFLAQIPYTRGLPSQLMSSLIWNGQRGVQIFFAVSGFLITSTSLRRWNHLTNRSVREFYQLRFARIAPLLLLLLAVLSLLHAADFHDYVVTEATGGLERALLAALTFHINVLEAARGYLPGNWDVLWSLSVEEMFYLFFPLLLRMLGRGKPLVALMLVFAALGPFARTVWARDNAVWQEYSYLGGMDAIALGCLTALGLARIRIRDAPLRFVGGIGAALLILCLGFTHQTAAWGLDSAGLDMTAVAVATCMVIAAAAQTQWRSSPTLRPLLALGRCSYEIYLTHMFVVFAAYRLFVAVGRPMGAVPVLFVAVILIAGLLGTGVAKVYSEPANRWLRRRWGDGAGRFKPLINADRGPPQGSV
jgi:peptidoglycan/LPS O-acetylase OafA/YrhL